MTGFQRQPRREDMRDRDLERRVRALEARMAVEVPIDPLPGSDAQDVQQALAFIATKIDASSLVDAPDDATAESLGVEQWGFYRDGSVLMVRVV